MWSHREERLGHSSMSKKPISIHMSTFDIQVESCTGKRSFSELVTLILGLAAQPLPYSVPFAHLECEIGDILQPLMLMTDRGNSLHPVSTTYLAVKGIFTCQLSLI